MRRMVNIAFVVLFVSFAVSGSAQRLRDWMNLGDQALKAGDPYGALQYYGEAMKIDSAKGEVNYKYAEALRLNQQYAAAARYYYKVYRRDYGKVYPEGGAWLATMQMQSGRYNDAKQTWRRVRKQYAATPESYWYRKAVQAMRACDLAGEWTAEPPAFDLDPADGAVNSEASEFAGFFDDSGQLIFSSLRGKFDTRGRLISPESDYVPRLYMADSTFAKANPLALPARMTEAFNYAVSADETRVAISSRDAEGHTRIFILNAARNKILKVIPFPSDTAWYSHPAFGMIENREVLFFASDREGGFGREDIWYWFTDQPEFAPVNAGENVNTPGSEITPYYRSDTRKLYFASNWHYGLGGYDLFVSDEHAEEFSYPENLKPPFNTPANDMYYSINRVTGKGSVTSNRRGAIAASGEGCCNDLWIFAEERVHLEDSLPDIETLDDLNAYLPVRLFFHNDEPNPRTRAETTDQNYLETYRNYLKMLPEYETEYSAGLGEAAANEAEEAMDTFFRNEVDKGVENLKLFTRLLAQELSEGKRIALTVKGFASPLAKTDYNVRLTSRRIASLENYLREFDRGVLQPYIDGRAENGGKLEIIKIPFGEYTASAVVSDNPNASNAIYSIAAARERKIEIVSVQRAGSDTTLAEVRFDTEIIDFGSIASSDSLEFSFRYHSKGVFEIDSLVYNREVLTLNPEIYNSDADTRTLSGILHPTNLSGKQNAVISVYGNITERKKELNLTFEIEAKP